MHVTTLNNSKNETQTSSESLYPSYQRSSASEFLSLFDFESEEFLRWFYSPNSSVKKDKNRFIGNTDKSKTFDESKKRHRLRSSYNSVKRNTDNNNLYWTPNEFYGWRCRATLAKIHANWIDIDTVGHKKLNDAEAQELLEIVMIALEEANIPAPTGYVLTGFGGIHFYWIYDEFINGLLPTNQIAWKEIARAIIKRLSSKLGSDICEIDSGCSTDISRIMRLPGSIRTIQEPKLPQRAPIRRLCKSDKDFNEHAKNHSAAVANYEPRMAEYERIISGGFELCTDKKGRLYREVHGYAGGQTYKFKELADLLDVSIDDRPVRKIKTSSITALDVAKKVKKPTIKGRATKRANSKHNIKTWWHKNYWHIINHARKNGVHEGQRDSYAFILFICLQQMHGCSVVAMSEIKKINKTLIGLTETELEQYLNTAINGKDKNRDGFIYQYSKKGLANYLEDLGINSAYLFENDKVKLTKEQVKERRSDGAAMTANKKASETLKKLQDTVDSILDKDTKATQKAVAEASEVSIATVKRHWKDIEFRKVSLAPLLYISLPSKESLDLESSCSVVNGAAASLACSGSIAPNLVVDVGPGKIQHSQLFKNLAIHYIQKFPEAKDDEIYRRVDVAIVLQVLKCVSQLTKDDLSKESVSQKTGLYIYEFERFWSSVCRDLEQDQKRVSSG